MTPYLPDINEPHLHFSSTLEYRIIQGGGRGLEVSPKTNNRGGLEQLEGGKNDTIFSNIILTRYIIKVNVKRNEKTLVLVSLMKCVQICTRFPVGFELQ